MFNPNARLSVLDIDAGQRCWILDDVLAEPDRWVERAVQARAAFAESDRDAYPGPQLALPDAVAARLDALFAARFRAELGARRTLGVYCRLAMVTWPPERLAPRQWLCHRDRFNLPAEQCVAASVLYLFDDERLGGTSFFRPRRPEYETAVLVHESGQLSAAAFTAKYGFTPGYFRGSNPWFEHLVTVPPRYNRIVFYDGGLFHCSDIAHPELLCADPARGRLTMNGFFTCTRRAR
jgi:hypothetical protein